MPTLPAWLSCRDDGVFEIDPDLAYPAVFEALGVAEADIDQYWIEVAYQCCKLHVQELRASLEPAPKAPLQIHVHGFSGRKDRWALANHPRGRGPEAATQGREARSHYARIRHRLAA
jgi:hypothetical protein